MACSCLPVPGRSPAWVSQPRAAWRATVTMAPLYPLASDGPRPLHFTGLTMGRLNQFESLVQPALYEARLDGAEVISFERWSVPGLAKVPFSEAKRQKYERAHKGVMLGPSWSQHWFKVEITLPHEFKDKERVQLEWDSSCESTVYDTEGKVLLGITGGYGVDRKVDFILDPKLRSSTYKVSQPASLLSLPHTHLTHLRRSSTSRSAGEQLRTNPCPLSAVTDLPIARTATPCSATACERPTTLPTPIATTRCVFTLAQPQDDIIV